MKTLHTTQISGAEQKPKPVEDADFDAFSEDYISREEKNAYKPLPLKTRRKKKSEGTIHLGSSKLGPTQICLLCHQRRCQGLIRK
jgi:hypothetical protein